MTRNENHQEAEDLGHLLSRCFAGGEMLRRELRLTEAQAARLAELDRAGVIPMGEQWYEITFQEAFKYGCN